MSFSDTRPLWGSHAMPPASSASGGRQAVLFFYYICPTSRCDRNRQAFCLLGHRSLLAPAEKPFPLVKPRVLPDHFSHLGNPICDQTYDGQDRGMDQITRQ